MKTITIGCLALVLLTSVSSCRKKDETSTHYTQKKDVNSTPERRIQRADADALMTVYDVNASPSWRIRGVNISDMDPLEFLSLLQTTERETVQIAPAKDGWVKEADLPKLFALLDSQERCARVIAPDWSPHVDMHKPSTVGREAGFLIKFFRMEGIPPSRYPVGLGLTMSDEEKEDLRKWWAQYQDERD